MKETFIARVIRGVRHASGLDPKFHRAAGTIELQLSAIIHTQMGQQYIELGKKLEKMNIYKGTINCKLDKPLFFKPQEDKGDYIVKDLKWDHDATESFIYIKAEIEFVDHDIKKDCFIYRPMLNKLSEHPRDILEIICEESPVAYGDQVIIHIDKYKLKEMSLLDKAKLKFNGGDVESLQEVKDED
jgi:hypothetical protein